MDFWELWQPSFSQHPVWLLAISCQKLSPMHIEAELFWVLLTKCGPYKIYAAGVKTPD